MKKRLLNTKEMLFARSLVDPRPFPLWGDSKTLMGSGAVIACPGVKFKRVGPNHTEYAPFKGIQWEIIKIESETETKKRQ